MSANSSQPFWSRPSGGRGGAPSQTHHGAGQIEVGRIGLVDAIGQQEQGSTTTRDGGSPSQNTRDDAVRAFRGHTPPEPSGGCGI